jgi:hypothetical protein
MKLSFDTMGPATYGVCLRQNVSTALDEWPKCRRALLNKTDIRSGDPYIEEGSTLGEPWPAACATEALTATTEIRPRLLNQIALITDLKRWDLDCDYFHLETELLVAKNGRVKCARVAIPEKISATLHSEVLANVHLLRFAPPQMNGTAVAVRLYLIRWKPCNARD